jgi:PAS domain S-box-containing protein
MLGVRCTRRKAVRPFIFLVLAALRVSGVVPFPRVVPFVSAAQSSEINSSSRKHALLFFSDNSRVHDVSDMKPMADPKLQDLHRRRDYFVENLDPFRLGGSIHDMVLADFHGETYRKPRWDISEPWLPQRAIVPFQATSVWNVYRWYVPAGLLGLLTESALIFLLLLERHRRKWAQASLMRNFEIERVLAELSTALSNCSVEEIETEIEVGLQAILDAENVDLVSWFTVPEELHKNYSANFARGEPQISFPRPSRLPWAAGLLSSGSPVVITRLNDLPTEANWDREYLSEERVKSIAFVPAASGNGSRGVLCLACLGCERSWPKTLISRLGVLANIIADALLRKRTQEARQASERQFRHLFEQAPMGIALEDMQGRLLFVNPALCSMLGYTEGEMRALSCDRFADPEDSADDWALFKELEAGHRDSYQIQKRYSRKDGEKVWGRLSVSRLRFQTTDMPMVMAMVEDITEHKEAEDKLKHAQSALHRLPSRLIQAQEQERQRIARELHDDIGQRLSLMAIELEHVNRELPLIMSPQYGNFATLLEKMDELTTDIHQLSHQLHSSKLQYLGLKAALNELCQQVPEQHEIQVVQQVEDMPLLSSEVQLCLYRIAQEALNNVVRHSRASEASVQLAAHHGLARLEIRDTGIGFDPGATREGLGLASMRERVRIVGGNFSVNSSHGKGTKIVAEAPYVADAGMAEAS